MLGMNMMKATATGNIFNQHRSINWSYLNLGNVALNQTKIKQKIQVLTPKTMLWMLTNESLMKISGIWYPPKNNIAVIQLNNTIEEYSPKKKNTNIVLLCSVKNPATNSDSASCKSKGVLEVSAKIDMK
jgi:hypothetical protein